MPCVILGSVRIADVEGTIVTGDTFAVAPRDTSKVIAGAGGFNTGDFHNNFSGISVTVIVNPKTADGFITEGTSTLVPPIQVMPTTGAPSTTTPPTTAPPAAAPPAVVPPAEIPIGTPPQVFLP